MAEDGTFAFLLFRRRFGTVAPCAVTSFFYGQVRSSQGGSEVLGRLTLHPSAKGLIALLFVAALVGGAVCAWSVATIPDCAPRAGWAVSSAYAAIAAVMLGLRRRFARTDGPVILRYLTECAGDESGPYR
jgi:hypothetical protein